MTERVVMGAFAGYSGGRSRPPASTRPVMPDRVTIKLSSSNEAIERLAQLDSARCPSGRVLIAAVDGEPRAALPLDGGPPIADPFHPTLDLVSLLELRAAQMNGGSGAGPIAALIAALRRSRTQTGGRNGSTDR